MKLPDPGELSSGWWVYFDTEPTLLKTHIAEASQSYSSLLNKLAESDRNKALINFNRFIKNLKTLQKLKLNKVSEPIIETTIYAENYDIFEWLEIINNSQQELADWDHHHQLLKRSVDALQVTQKRLNSQMLLYIESTENPRVKILLGMEIMANRSYFALSNEQLKQEKLRLDIQKSKLNRRLKLKKNSNRKVICNTRALKTN